MGNGIKKISLLHKFLHQYTVVPGLVFWRVVMVVFSMNFGRPLIQKIFSYHYIFFTPKRILDIAALTVHSFPQPLISTCLVFVYRFLSVNNSCKQISKTCTMVNWVSFTEHCNSKAQPWFGVSIVFESFYYLNIIHAT